MAVGQTPNYSQGNPYNTNVSPIGVPASVGAATSSGGGGTQNDTPYPPTSFTLNATGTGAVVKFQSYDGTYESINGTLGGALFTVTELPDRASIGRGAVSLLGADVIAYFLSVYALRIDYVNYQATTSGQLSNPLKFYTAGIDGTNTTRLRSVAKDLSNLANVSTLQPIGNIPVLKHNTAMTVLVNNTVVVGLTFAVNSVIPYTQFLGMGFTA